MGGEKTDMKVNGWQTKFWTDAALGSATFLAVPQFQRPLVTSIHCCCSIDVPDTEIELEE